MWVFAVSYGAAREAKTREGGFCWREGRVRRQPPAPKSSSAPPLPGRRHHNRAPLSLLSHSRRLGDRLMRGPYGTGAAAYKRRGEGLACGSSGGWQRARAAAGSLARAASAAPPPHTYTNKRAKGINSVGREGKERGWLTRQKLRSSSRWRRGSPVRAQRRTRSAKKPPCAHGGLPRACAVPGLPHARSLSPAVRACLHVLLERLHERRLGDGADDRVHLLAVLLGFKRGGRRGPRARRRVIRRGRRDAASETTGGRLPQPPSPPPPAHT